MQWRWIEGGTVTLAEVSGTWSTIAGIGKEGSQWKEEGWNMGEERSRRFMIKETI